MNFKPTLWKTIVSLLVLIIIDYILVRNFCFTMTLRRCNLTEMLNFTSLLISLGVAIVAYVIWSLFQKKK